MTLILSLAEVSEKDKELSAAKVLPSSTVTFLLLESFSHKSILFPTNLITKSGSDAFLKSSIHRETLSNVFSFVIS